MKVLLFFVVYTISLISLLAIGSEEVIFRDELHSDSTEPDVSIEKYQKELAKLLKPRQTWDINLKYIVFPLAAIALTIIVIFFIKQIRLNIIRNVGDDEPDIVVEEVQTEKAALSRAETAVEANDFRGAIRYLYLSAVLHLQENGILPYDKSLTNREYLQQSKLDSNMQTALDPAISVFDEVWYGYRPCDEETVLHYRELLRNVYSSENKSSEVK